MLGFGSRGLRFRLLVLVFLAVLPALVIVLHTGLEQRRQAVLSVSMESRRLVSLATAREKQLVDNGRRILESLAELRQLQDGDCAEILPLLHHAGGLTPEILNFGVADMEGRVTCSAASPPGDVSIADRAYFRKVIETNRFAVGIHQVDRIMGVPALHFAAPVRDDTGSQRSVLFATLDLSWFTRLARDMRLPEGATLTVRDRNGTILARHPEADEWTGRVCPTASILHSILEQSGEGIAEAEGVDKVTRLYAFEPLDGAPESGVYLSVGIPSAVVFAESNQGLIRNAFYILAAFLLAALAAWFGGDIFILRGVKRLISSTLKVASGDYSTRASGSRKDGVRELEQLAHAFDEMAQSIESRETLLEQAEARARELVEQVPAVFYRTAPGGLRPIQFLSGQAEPILHLPPGAGLSEPHLLHDRVHETDRERVFAVFEATRLRAPGSEIHLEYRMVLPDGGEIWVRDEARVVETDKDGGRVVQGFIRDVTRRRQAEEDRQDSESRYRTIFETAGAATMLIGSDGIIRLTNGTFEKLSGFERTDVVGKRSFLDFFAPDQSRRMLEYHHARRTDPEAAPRAYESRFRTVSGEFRDVMMNVAMIPGTMDSVASLVDLTESRRAAEALKNSEERLRQAQKMEAIGKLAGGVAHDFNNILVAIRSCCDELRERLSNGSPLMEPVDEIAKACGRGASLTRQLLTFSRKQLIQPRPLDLNVVVAEVESMLKRLIGRRVILDCRLGAGMGPVLADPNQVEQVIVNLALNARDAMPEGGRLLIETRDLGTGRQNLPEELARHPSGCVLLSVSDTGVGMEEETLQHMFEPFFTTKPPGSGTGLGLSTVYGIVKQTGGAIHVTSEPERGTTFRIYLPKTAEGTSAEKTAPAPPPTRRIPVVKETVLLVEDDEFVRRTLGVVIESSGYHVFTTGDPFEALKLVEDLPAQPDLLMCDMSLPGMNGTELATRIRAEHPEMRLLFISGYPESCFRGDPGMPPDAGFLQKPFSVSELGAKLGFLLSSKP